MSSWATTLSSALMMAVSGGCSGGAAGHLQSVPIGLSRLLSQALARLLTIITRQRPLNRLRKNGFWQSDVSGPGGGDVQIGPERRSGMPRGRIQVAISKGWEGPSDPVGRSAPQADHIA